MTDIVQMVLTTTLFTGKVVLYTFAAGVATGSWFTHLVHLGVN